MKFFLQVMLLCLSTAVVAQTQISGTVTDANGQPVPGASVVLDSNTGTVTDFDGNFSLNTSKTPPFTLTVSNVGLETKTVNVSSATQSLSISLGESATQLDEIVVSASRFAQRIFESPVTVEKFSLKQIELTPSADFFNGLANLRGVNLIEGGLVFSQVTIRGFSDIYNEGLVTLVDGMNNQLPVFNFGVGNILGLNELDVNSVELLPGASSALYGADAIKGIMFINSKNPFDYQGVSVSYRTGVTEQDTAGTNEFKDFNLRMATQLGDKWAIKAAFSHKEGTDWSAEDYRHVVNNPGGRTDVIEGYDVTRPDYDGVNIEGERAVETATQFGILAQAAAGIDMTLVPRLLGAAVAAPSYFDTVLTTGYKDNDMFGNDTSNTKGNFAIHFRPNDKSEISLQSLIGTGRAPLSTGGTRYHLDDFKLQQHKLQINSGGFSGLFYYTKEDAGNTLVSQLMSLAIANQQPGGIAGPGGWVQRYFNNYFGTIAGGAANVPSLISQIIADVESGGQSFNDRFGIQGSTKFAHDIARYGNSALGVVGANSAMLQPGTPQFKEAFNNASKLDASQLGFGARIVDISKVYNYEANYDFGDKLGFGDVLVGASFRNFKLDTQGTLYNDGDTPIDYIEYGAYAQVKKDLFDDFVTMTASIRYDRQDVLVEGNFTPRLGLLFNLSENQNIRFTAQQGFRNPTNQDKFIAYSQGNYAIIGSSKYSLDKLNFPATLVNQSTHIFTGDEILDNAVDIQSFAPANLDYVKPEVITSFELGYRYNSPGFSLDIMTYYSDYKDYISGRDVFVPVLVNNGILDTPAKAIAGGNFYQFEVDGNLDDKISTYGGSFEIVKSITNNFNANLNYEYNKLDYTPSTTSSGDEISFNTPEHRIKGGINFSYGNLNISTNVRHNSEIDYRSSFFDAFIPSNTVFDAKLSYEMPGLNSTLEIGGNNIGGDNYVSLPGSGLIGSVYYAALKMSL